MQGDWWELVIGIIPSLLGFTLGAFALIMATATDRFGAVLSKARKFDEPVAQAPLAELSSAFVHFILVQLVAIVFACAAKLANATHAPVFADWLSHDATRAFFWGIGMLSACYALLLTVATTHWIFELIMWLIAFHKRSFKVKKEDTQ